MTLDAMKWCAAAAKHYTLKLMLGMRLCCTDQRRVDLMRVDLMRGRLAHGAQAYG